MVGCGVGRSGARVRVIVIFGVHIGRGGAGAFISMAADEVCKGGLCRKGAEPLHGCLSYDFPGAESLA
jgi:hypothetical protein